MIVCGRLEKSELKILRRHLKCFFFSSNIEERQERERSGWRLWLAFCIIWHRLCPPCGNCNFSYRRLHSWPWSCACAHVLESGENPIVELDQPVIPIPGMRLLSNSVAWFVLEKLYESITVVLNLPHVLWGPMVFVAQFHWCLENIHFPIDLWNYWHLLGIEAFTFPGNPVCETASAFAQPPRRLSCVPTIRLIILDKLQIVFPSWEDAPERRVTGPATSGHRLGHQQTPTVCQGSKWRLFGSCLSRKTRRHRNAESELL